MAEAEVEGTVAAVTLLAERRVILLARPALDTVGQMPLGHEMEDVLDRLPAPRTEGPQEKEEGELLGSARHGSCLSAVGYSLSVSHFGSSP